MNRPTTKRYYGPVRRKHLRNLYVIEYDPMTRRKRLLTTGCRTVKDAKVVLEEMRRTAALPAWMRNKMFAVVSEAAEVWYHELEVRLAKPTLEKVGRSIKLWSPHIAPLAISEVDPQHIRSFLSSRKKLGHAAKTVNQELQHLKWFFNWARQSGYVPVSPCDGVKPFKVPEKFVRIIDPEEEKAFLEQIPVKDAILKALVVFAVETGLRRRALLSITWEMVDLEKGWMRLPGSLLKSGRDFRAPLSERALEVLQRMPRGSVGGRIFPIGLSALQHKWHRARKKAGLAHFTLHDARRTFVTRALQRGVAPEVVMKLSDHRDLKVVMSLYRRVQDKELIAAVGREKRHDEGLPGHRDRAR
jgi:integrase